MGTLEKNLAGMRNKMISAGPTKFAVLLKYQRREFKVGYDQS